MRPFDYRWSVAAFIKSESGLGETREQFPLGGQLVGAPLGTEDYVCGVEPRPNFLVGLHRL